MKNSTVHGVLIFSRLWRIPTSGGTDPYRNSMVGHFDACQTLSYPCPTRSSSETETTEGRQAAPASRFNPPAIPHERPFGQPPGEQAGQDRDRQGGRRQTPSQADVLGGDHRNLTRRG